MRGYRRKKKFCKKYGHKKYDYVKTIRTENGFKIFKECSDGCFYLHSILQTMEIQINSSKHYPGMTEEKFKEMVDVYKQTLYDINEKIKKLRSERDAKIITELMTRRES